MNLIWELLSTDDISCANFCMTVVAAVNTKLVQARAAPQDFRCWPSRVAKVVLWLDAFCEYRASTNSAKCRAVSELDAERLQKRACFDEGFSMGVGAEYVLQPLREEADFILYRGSERGKQVPILALGAANQ